MDSTQSTKEAPSALADLIVFGGLIALTATFGRGFSTIGFSGPSIYVTEVALAISALLAIRRLGLAGVAAAIRERVPLIPLGLFWLAAVVALIVGIADQGLRASLEDIGLGEYSLLVPLIAAVASTPSRAKLLMRIVVGGLIAGTAVYALSDFWTRVLDGGDFLFDVQEITYGLYMSMLVSFVASRMQTPAGASRPLLGVGFLALLLVFLSNARGIWVSVIVGLIVVVILAPGDMRLRFGAGAAAAVACTFALAVGIQELSGASQITNEVSGAVNGAQGETGTTADISETENAEWRLAFWREIIDRAPSHPVFGVGYGQPIAFTWRGLKYDFRDGDPDAAIDVDGPHNEFLHVLYRMGIVGLAGLIGLIGVALWRAAGAIRAGIDDVDRRADIVALAAMLMTTAAVACFADSLKSPFLGLFFWTALGLLLATVPRRRAEASPSPSA